MNKSVPDQYNICVGVLFDPVALCSVNVAPDIFAPLCCIVISLDILDGSLFLTNQTKPALPAPSPAVVKFCVIPDINIYVVFADVGISAVVPAA